MFVGDSLSENQWMSLACMLHAAAPDAKTSYTKSTLLSSITFQQVSSSPLNPLKSHSQLHEFSSQIFFFFLPADVDTVKVTSTASSSWELAPVCFGASRDR